MLAIFKKELRSYFTSIIGYLFIAFLLALIGLFFYYDNMLSGATNFAYPLYDMSMFFILLVPMLTMRIMAEENRQKTDQLLFTSPITIGKIILGKFFAVLTVFGIGLAVTCVYPLILKSYGNVNLKMSYTAILAFFFMGAAFMSIGLFISAMTESQAFAAVITFVVILVSCLSTSIAGIMPTDNKTAWIVFALIFLAITAVTYVMMHNIVLTFFFGCAGEIVIALLYILKPTLFDGSIEKVFSWFSILSRYDNFAYGVFDVSALVYYISIISLFVFLTIQAIKKRRWS